MKDSNTYCVILAGGIGTRFWPLSTSNYPKQFHDVLGVGSTLIQQTYERLLNITSADKIFVITDTTYVDLIHEQLPQVADEQIIIEPIGMNTAPGILYSSLKLKILNPGAKIVFCPSDHLIIYPQIFTEKINLALQNLDIQEGLFTLGINPLRPDTGYGYIQYIEGEEEVKKVKTFTEKPNKDLAEKFIQSGDFLWNSGIFIWKADTILKAFQEYLPEMYEAMDEINLSIGTDDEYKAVSKVYPTLQKISIDTGILEKCRNVFVIPSTFGWSDLGTWSSLYENSPKDENGNAVKGNLVKLYNAKNNIVSINREKAVVIEGLENFIVVNTEKALLICPLSSDQTVKKFVNDIRLTKGGDQFL